MTSKKKARRGRPAGSTVGGSKSDKIRELLKTGMPAGAIAKQVGATTGLVYNVKSRMSGTGAARRTGRPQKSGSAKAPGANGLEQLVTAVQAADRERVLETLRSAAEGGGGA